jgi:hypothetical protein
MRALSHNRKVVMSEELRPIVYPSPNGDMPNKRSETMNDASIVTNNPLLPKPTFPNLAMPEPPIIPGQSSEAQHPSCVGEVYTTKPSPDTIPHPAPGMLRIMIGVPILTWSHEFAESFLKFWTQICMSQTKKFEAGYFFAHRKPVHMAEQQILDVARYNKCTHILFMDDDIYDVTLEMLQKLIDADKEVISGVMYASGFPYAMCAFRRYDDTKKVIDMPSDNRMFRLYEIPCRCIKCGNGISHWDAKFCPVCGEPQDNLIQKVDLIPFPFTLIKVSALDKMKKPIFHCEIEYPSDSWFADRCQEAGVQEYVHMGVRLNHRGITDATRQHYFQMGLDKTKQGAGCVTISQEDMHKHELILHNKMKEAEDKLKPKLNLITPENQKAAEDATVVSEPAVAGIGEPK